MISNYTRPLPGQTMTQLGSNQIIQNAHWNLLETSAMDAGTREQGQASIARIAQTLDDFDADISAIQQNPELSAQGRVKAMSNKSTSYLTRLNDQTGATLAALQLQINTLNKSLAQAAKGPDASVVSEIRAQEVRREFSQVTDILRPTEYFKLISTGNTAAALAIENAPGTPLIDAQIMAEGQAQRAQALLPEAAYKKDGVTLIFDALTACVRAAKKHLGLSPLVDPLQMAPTGV